MTFDRAEESGVLTGPVSDGHQLPQHQASLLMGKSAAVDIQVNINERVSTLELEIKESREAVEAKEALIQ